MKHFLKLMRVHHYIKNLLIFTPLLFSGLLFSTDLLFMTIIGFISFSLVASTIYIVNDIQDVEADRLHETKKLRPLASDAISINQAKILAYCLLVIVFILQFVFFKDSVWASIILITYFILNILYSNSLKHYPIMDISILVSGFVLRVLYGSSITSIEISNWLYLTILMMSFYLALGKRRNELQKHSAKSRKVLQYYNQSFLDKNMYMCLALTIGFYSLWTVDPVTISRLTNDYLVWTVPLVIIICMKYSLNIEKESDGDPVEVILKDKVLLALLVAFLFVCTGIIYL